jgi:hypothetical protein
MWTLIEQILTLKIARLTESNCVLEITRNYKVMIRNVPAICGLEFYNKNVHADAVRHTLNSIKLREKHKLW